MEREYIWAAHDTAGVNELHVAIDRFDREAWPIQDPHNQSVYGYTDPVGELVEQRVYAPFGQILSADKTPLATPSGLYFDFRLRLGMHGMLAERLDASTTDPLLRHADARVVYLTPNRTYDPQTGLWWQGDPNATGSLTSRLSPVSGEELPVRVSPYDHELSYTDGLNLSLAHGGNAVEFIDPTGLLLLGFMTRSGVESELRRNEASVKGGVIDSIRARIAANLGKYYSTGLQVADDILMEFAGASALGGAGSYGMYKMIESLGGNHTGELCTLAKENFRRNFEIMSGFEGRIGDFVLQAHHIRPQRFREQFARMGINVDNPLFGQWVDPDTHRRIHDQGYDTEWARFVTELQREGISGESAFNRVVSQMHDLASEDGFMIPF